MRWLLLVLAVMVAGTIALAALGEGPASRPPEPVAFGTVQDLGNALYMGGAGCQRIYTRLIGLPDTPGEHWATCLVGTKSVTLHVFDDPSHMTRYDWSDRRSGSTWVVGPNWFVASMHRPEALVVASAIGGLLVPSHDPGAD